MAAQADTAVPATPFPLFRVASNVERYMLYDADVVTWLRKTYHILGVLVGTLPQIPQQNVFLGLPLELMPEEARLLVEKGIAYTVNDFEWHMTSLPALNLERIEAFKQMLARDGIAAARAADQKKLASTERAMRRLRLNSTPVRESVPASDEGTDFASSHQDTETLFAEDERPFIVADKPPQSASTTQPWHSTPTTAYPPLPTPPATFGTALPNVKPGSYALFKHLHDRDYYMSPGLRFGCEFCVYPGDPLRFHSHFLAVSAEWDEEIDLLDIIGGGRLGTGVKKGFLIGGPANGLDRERNPETGETAVRAFCIEWGGM